MKKDKEWLKKEISKRDKGTIYTCDLMCLINNLDEPEVLSHEWIRNNQERKGVHFFVNVTKLQNLVVPKKELPVIPKFVADWVIRHRDTYDLYPALRMLENNTLVWGEIYEWYRMNTHKFVNAYLTGEYEVEKEPLYYAKLKEVYPPKKEWLVNLTAPRYYVVNTRGLMFGEFTLDLVGVKTNASTYGLEEWGSYGINDDIVDFVKVEEDK